MSFAFSAVIFGFAMNIARTAVLALAVLSVTAGRPASAQTFQERWSPIPRADAAEKPLVDQDQTLLGRSQQQVTTPPDRSHSHARLPHDPYSRWSPCLPQYLKPLTAASTQERHVNIRHVSRENSILSRNCFVVRDHNG